MSKRAGNFENKTKNNRYSGPTPANSAGPGSSLIVHLDKGEKSPTNGANGPGRLWSSTLKLLAQGRCRAGTGPWRTVGPLLEDAFAPCTASHRGSVAVEALTRARQYVREGGWAGRGGEYRSEYRDYSYLHTIGLSFTSRAIPSPTTLGIKKHFFTLK